MMFRSHRRVFWVSAAGIVVAALGAGAALVATAGSAAGAPSQIPVFGRQFVYTAQFNCGLIPQDGVPLDPLNPPSGFPLELPAKPANYATDINVHNPQRTVASFTKKAVLSGWVGTVPGATTVTTSLPEQQFEGGHLIPVRLFSDGAFEVDCVDIEKVLAPPGFDAKTMTFIKGFVVIQSSIQLDVAATYTSERVGTSTIHCLLSNGTVVNATVTAAGTSCPGAPATGVSTVGIASDNPGTGLSLDVEYITPKIVMLTPGPAAGGNTGN